MIGPLIAVLLFMSLAVIGQAFLTSIPSRPNNKRIAKPSRLAIKGYILCIVLLVCCMATNILSYYNQEPLSLEQLTEVWFMSSFLPLLFGMVIQFLDSMKYGDADDTATKVELWEPEYRPPLFGYGYTMYHLFFYFELLSYIGQYPVAWLLMKFRK
jgi:hypothetical protein